MKITIVEDEKNIREELRRLLVNSFYQVTVIDNFEDVANQVLEISPDLILLDINLPDESGQEICRKIREQADIPVIFLTSDESIMTELNSMLIGGDDYITKPYHPSLLLARISAVLKRTQKQNNKEETELNYKDVCLNLCSYKVEYQGRQTELSKNEFKLLHYLFQRKTEVIPRLDIMEHLWDNDVFIDDNALSVNITRLRSKMEEIGVTDFIKTKRGVGYQI